MAERVLFKEWRKSNETSKFPFSERATLTNSNGRILTEGVFLDAALYPVGNTGSLFLSQVSVDHENVVLTIGFPGNRSLATGVISLINASDNVIFTDTYGRPAGILVSESQRLGIFQSWGVGVHTFEPAESEFAATVCFPTPEVGVRGIQLEDGTLFVGDVWLVGADGVIFRSELVTIPASCTQVEKTIKAIRMDVIGDPLFRRRLCVPTNLFNTPRMIKQIKVIGPNATFYCSPDNLGDIKLTVNNGLASDTILRIVTTPTGIIISTAGSKG